MKNIFRQVQAKRPNSNTFDLSHDRKLSCDPGQLIPIMMEEVLPGDKWNVKSSVMVRFAPMLAPIMHQVNAYVHYFFVPNRLMWDNWEAFITGGEDGEDESVYPTVQLGNGDRFKGSLADYLGIPTRDEQTGILEVSAFPFSAYNLIYNEYYRDQNLIQALDDVLLHDGINTFEDLRSFNIQRRSWQHDYFTSALPFLQKGPEATLPLGSAAPIDRIDSGQSDLVFGGGSLVPGLVDPTPMWNTGPTPSQPGIGDIDVGPSGNMVLGDGTNPEISPDVSANHSARLSNWFADLGAATASSINDLRRAFKLQEWLEKNARGGSRYTEIIRSHFGVRSSDARLQRPEYFGGTKVNIQISEVLQTSAEDTQPTPQGNMAGHGIGYGAGKIGSKYCEEHGWIVGILSVMPKTAYQDGIPKKYRKYDKFDHYWPEFAHIGEQEIKNYEVYATHTNPEGTFGYIPRYAEYKFINSTVHGDFREQLDFWHWGRKLDENVSLNSQFINCVPDKRIFAVETEDLHVLWIHVYNSVKVRRLMPYFGNPKI